MYHCTPGYCNPGCTASCATLVRNAYAWRSPQPRRLQLRKRLGLRGLRLVLSENWTMTGGQADLRAVVRWAREAEDAPAGRGWRLPRRRDPQVRVPDGTNESTQVKALA
jgi:hypothetical protein